MSLPTSHYLTMALCKCMGDLARCDRQIIMSPCLPTCPSSTTGSLRPCTNISGASPSEQQGMVIIFVEFMKIWEVGKRREWRRENVRQRGGLLEEV